MLSNQDVSDAYKLVKELGDLRLKPNNADMYVLFNYSILVFIFISGKVYLSTPTFL